MHFARFVSGRALRELLHRREKIGGRAFAAPCGKIRISRKNILLRPPPVASQSVIMRGSRSMGEFYDYLRTVFSGRTTGVGVMNLPCTRRILTVNQGVLYTIPLNEL